MKDIVKLGTLGDIFIGLTYRPEDVANEGTIVLRSSNIQNGKLDFTDIVRVKCKVRENLIVKPNDILMCSRNGSAKLVGKCTLLPKMDEEMSFGAFMTIIRTRHNPYLLHFFNSNAFRCQLGSAATTTINQITRRMLDDISVPLYPKEQEDYIVSLFNQIDELIWTETQKLELFDELVKSRFIELFGDPNTNPMKWKKEPLQINATLLNGRAYKQDELLDNGKYPVLRVGNFFSNRGWYYSDLELDEDKYCDDGDLLYAWSASFGPRIWNGGKVIYHYHIWKVLVGEKYNKQFLCHLLDYATASLMGDTHGIGMMHLTKSGMEETEFIVPPIDLQNQFAAFVEQTDKSKLAVQQSITELEELKESLMQKYFG